MRTLMRVVMVVAAAALAVPALACSEQMQTSSVQATAQQPAVAKAQKTQSSKKAAKTQTAASKTQAPKVAQN
jgi:hypothetical protein